MTGGIDLAWPLALVGFGWLVGLYGAQAFLFAPLAAGVGALCIWLSLKMM